MTSPVTTTVAPARPSRGPDRSDPANGAGFASALDGALSTGRDATERQTDKADRAADRAADKTDRAADKTDRAARRAAHKADRAAEKAGDTSDATPPDAAEEAPADEVATETAVVQPDEAPTAPGLPASIWALLMGRTTSPETPADTTPATETAAPTPAVGAVPAATPTAPAAGPVSVAPAAPAAVDAPTVPAPAAPPAPGAPAQAAPTGPVPTGPVPTAAASPAPADLVALAGLTVVTAPADVAEAVDAGAPTAAPVAAPVVDTPVDGPATPAADVVAAPATLPGDATPDGATSDDGAPTPSAAPVAAADGAEPAAPAVPTAAVSAPQTAAPVTAAAPIAPATGADAAQPVAGQVARHVAVLRGAPDGSHTMTLVLTPETLGPVEVQVTVSKGTVDLTLRGAHEHGRAALLDALPDLRRDLQTAGLTTSRLEVDRETGGAWTNQQQTSQGAFADRGPQHGRGQDPGDGRSRPWSGAADIDTRVARPARPTTSRSTSPGVDVRV